MSLESKLIQGCKPEPETLTEIQRVSSLPTDKSLNFMVFETSFKNKKVYCCWSGGELVDGQPSLTLVGKAALESLINLPFGNDDTLIIQELKLGTTPLREKVRAAVMKAPEGAKICFIGDMQGELDGHMHKAFNLVKDTVNISH